MISSPGDFPGASRSLTAARWLVIAMLVALLFSPPVTNLAQLLLVLTMLASRELRARAWQACKQPLAMAALAFYIVVSVGVLYSIGGEATSMWGGWRKLLMLPLALALFDDPRWKMRLVHVFIGVCGVAALVSYGAILSGTLLPVAMPEPGIVIRNHSTQGMMFGIAAFAAAILALDPAPRPMARRLLLGAAAILLIVDIAAVTSGRSGYVVLLACSAVLVIGRLFLGRKVTVKSVVLAVVIFGLIVSTLALSPLARQRIDQAVAEMETHEQATTVTSMGIRMFFWKNTVAMIAERPLFGYGTGAFEEAYRRRIAGQSGVAATVTSDPHNQFLKIATEHGALGLAVFLVFLASAFLQRPAPYFRLMGLGALAAWCATSMANSHFSTFSEGLFIYLWLGALLANEMKLPLKRPG